MLRKYFVLTAIMILSIPLVAQFNTTEESLRKHVFTLASDSLLGRGFGTDQGAIAAEYIAQQFKDAGIEPLNGTYFHPFNHREGILNIDGINVAGVIPGSDPELKEEYIVLGAHFDHLGWKISDGDTLVYHGADDNASGTSAIIEIGRNMVHQKESLGRSIIVVAFDGEESGLIGSTRFVEDKIVPPEKIKLMFSLDMVGMYDAHGGLDLGGVKLLSNPEQIIGTLAGYYNITIKKTNGSIGQRTDTAPFGKIGIPAIHAYTGLESPYHKPADVADALDYEGMAKVANFISAATQQLSLTENLSDMQGPREGQADLSGTKVFRPGISVKTGSSNHNYKTEFYEGKTTMSAEAGLFANIRAARFLTIQPQVLYETKGSQHVDGKFRTHAITTPVNLLITSPDDVMVQTYFLVGGYFSYHFAGKVGNEAIDFQNVYENQEFGLSYGFGLQVMNLQLGISIRRGLSNLLQDPEAVNMTHKGVSFSLGYMF